MYMYKEKQELSLPEVEINSARAQTPKQQTSHAGSCQRQLTKIKWIWITYLKGNLIQYEIKGTDFPVDRMTKRDKWKYTIYKGKFEGKTGRSKNGFD